MKHNIYLKNINTTVFDIETTGLYSRKDRIISASFCDPTDGSLVQFFADTPDDETILTGKILTELSKYQAVITYNGDHFDLPFVLTRARKLGTADELPFFWSIDLYRWVKKYWPPAPSMESLSQKSMEFALGLSERRTDEIGGGECISLYARWVQTGDETARNKILLHNGDDVRQLARISHSLSSLPYHRIAFENGFLVPTSPEVMVRNVKIRNNILTAEAQTTAGMMSADIYKEGWHYVYMGGTGRIFLDIDLSAGESVKFADLEALPVDADDFFEFAGYRSGFLILEESGITRYREVNTLIRKMLEKLVTIK